MPVFGILERGGRVHCQIVKNCSKAKLQAIIEGRVEPSAEITSDEFRSYDGLVEAGFARHHRINKYYRQDRAVFSENGVHINGIESFWSYANAATPSSTGCEEAAFRPSSRKPNSASIAENRDLYKILLTSCRMNPLRR